MPPLLVKKIYFGSQFHKSVSQSYTHTHTYIHICSVMSALSLNCCVTPGRSHTFSGYHSLHIKWAVVTPSLWDSVSQNLLWAFTLLYPYSILLGSHWFCREAPWCPSTKPPLRKAWSPGCLWEQVARVRKKMSHRGIRKLSTASRSQLTRATHGRLIPGT